MKRTPHPPKIADAGEVPSPAKRARQTQRLKSPESTPPRGKGMKSAGGVAGGVPRPTKP